MTFRSSLLALVVCLAASVSGFGQVACTAVTLNNSAAFANASGGNGTFNATGTPGNCTKSASTTESWISLSFGGGTANPSTFGYTVQANNSVTQRVGTITVNGGLATFTITQTGVTCSFSLSPNSSTASSAGGTGSFTVSTTSECAWTPVSSASWLQVISGNGPGNGTVSYSFDPNTTTSTRSATISIGTANFTVNQNPACSFTLSPNFQQIRSSGETGSVTITANVSSCSRTAVSDSAWLTVPVGGSGTGNGTLSWTAAANTTASQRTGKITVGDAVFTVIQEGGTCSFTINPVSQRITATGAGGTFALTTTCSWQALSTANWLVVTGTTTGTGNATISFRADANPSAVVRSASITVGTTAFLVTQDAAACVVTTSTSTLDVPAAGGPGSFEVASSGGCTWTATSNAAWVTFTSVATGTGDATVTFNIAANTTPGARIATVTVGNRTITITQAGANCLLMIDPTSSSVASNASTGTINVTSTCQWTASSTVGWVTLVTGLSGTGNGAVGYSIAANPTASQRTGSIKVGNLTFNVTQGGGGCSITLAPKTATLAGGNTGGRFNVNGSVGCQWTPTSPNPWITISAFSSVNGSGAVDFTLQPNFSGAERTGTISVNGETFAVTQSLAKPALAAGGILNAASFKGGPVAPGEIITIYGTLLGPEKIETLKLTPDATGITDSLAATRVLVDGQAAPMIYTTATQISTIVPFEAQGKASVKVKVEYQGAQSDETDVPVAGTAPAIFTQSSTGSGLGAILNQDNSLNTAANGAARNSIIQIFANGGGQTTPAGQTGKLAGTPLPQFPAGRVTVRINNVDAPVVYSGAAPGLIQGLIQINARVPATAPIGAAVPIVIRINNVDSPAGVTVAVR